jgi:hypothetical protein
MAAEAPEITRAAHVQRRHDRMVELQAIQHRAEGYAVAAELPGWPAPAAVEGAVPDVLAQKDGRSVLIEVETEDTLPGKEYLAEHKAFRKWKEQDPKAREYKMVIA